MDLLSSLGNFQLNKFLFFIGDASVTSLTDMLLNIPSSQSYILFSISIQGKKYKGYSSDQDMFIIFQNKDKQLIFSSIISIIF